MRAKLTELLSGHNVPADLVAEKNRGGALENWLVLPDRVRAMCEHLFGRILATGEGDPLQKTISFALATITLTS